MRHATGNVIFLDRVLPPGRSHCHWLHAERRGERPSCTGLSVVRRKCLRAASGSRVLLVTNQPRRPAEGPSRAVRQCMLAWLPGPRRVPHWGAACSRTVSRYKVTNDYSLGRANGRKALPATYGRWSQLHRLQFQMHVRCCMAAAWGTPRAPTRRANFMIERQRNNPDNAVRAARLNNCGTCYGLSEAGTMLPGWR
jgi:hypothetical protein